MRETIEYFFIYLHIISALYWVGGNLLFFSFGYTIRKIYKDEKLVPGFRALGKTFRVGSWISVIILFLTGIYLLLKRWGYINNTMKLKLSIFFVVIILKFIHDFFIAKRAALEEKPSKYYKLTLFIARLNLLLQLVIIYLSMIFVR
ncbi:MAG: hypothetical protein ABIM85_02235 [candidate division WOR-3 bacterium]